MRLSPKKFQNEQVNFVGTHSLSRRLCRGSIPDALRIPDDRCLPILLRKPTGCIPATDWIIQHRKCSNSTSPECKTSELLIRILASPPVHQCHRKQNRIICLTKKWILLLRSSAIIG
ncbi:uncharacterized protein LOC134690322 [Mytilus trossulus]|uniref:uncharacterized protein LOC134690322 n=1 Tax=Mytilus trossulus TaxID=6551 RepID=UPI0030069330